MTLLVYTYLVWKNHLMRASKLLSHIENFFSSTAVSITSFLYLFFVGFYSPRYLVFTRRRMKFWRSRKFCVTLATKTLAIPCNGRMLTPKSSSWLRALMRSSSSWMTWGQSVISWRHALGRARGAREKGWEGGKGLQKEEEREKVSQHFVSATATQRSATEKKRRVKRFLREGKQKKYRERWLSAAGDRRR